MNLRQKCKAVKKAMNYIGISGYYDDVIKMFHRNPPKLTLKEIAFVRPIIQEERERRWNHWREMCIKHLGDEDPGEIGEHPLFLPKKERQKRLGW